MTTCIQWSTIDEEMFRPLCTNILRRETLPDGHNANPFCHLCETPFLDLDPAPITNCSPVLLPDPTKAYLWQVTNGPSVSLNPEEVTPLTYTDVSVAIAPSDTAFDPRAVAVCNARSPSYTSLGWTCIDNRWQPYNTKGPAGAWSLGDLLQGTPLTVGSRTAQGAYYYCTMYGEDAGVPTKANEVHSTGLSALPSSAWDRFPYRPPPKFMSLQESEYVFPFGGKIIVTARTPFAGGPNWNSPLVRYQISVNYAIGRYMDPDNTWMTYSARTGNGMVGHAFAPPLPWAYTAPLRVKILTIPRSGTFGVEYYSSYSFQASRIYSSVWMTKTDYMTKKEFALTDQSYTQYLTSLANPFVADHFKEQAFIPAYYAYPVFGTPAIHVGKFQMPYNTTCPNGAGFNIIRSFGTNTMSTGWSSSIKIKRIEGS